MSRCTASTRLRARPPHRWPHRRHARILILDFGAQYTQLIARRLRETHVYCEIHPYDVGDDFVRAFAPKGIILSGGPTSVYDEGDTPRAPDAVWTLGVPVLGICYGMQTMAHAARRQRSSRASVREFGYAEMRARGHSALFRDIEDRAQRRRARPARRLDEPRRQGHRDAAGLQADRLVATRARSPAWPTSRAASTPCSSIPRSRTRRRARRSSRASRTRSAAAATTGTCTTTSTRRSRRSARRSDASDVILGLSGGVDSSVAAALIHRAIGDQLTCVFVDHGLLRLDEATQVMDTFARNLGVQGRSTSMRPSEFLAALAGVDDPEQKRKIIGRLFVDVFQREAAKLPRRALARAGNDLPGRDRVGGREDEEGAHDQVASQRRRPARDAASEAARAAARAVQGRGARARARARAAARDGVSPSVSRARAWACASSARSSASTPTCCAARTRSSSTSCALRATSTASPGTTRPRRRSPCSCRCARSA